MPKPFCVYHDKAVELEDGYQVLPCKLYYKVCGFKLAGAHYCPDVELLPYAWGEYFKTPTFNAHIIEYHLIRRKDCKGDQCKL